MNSIQLISKINARIEDLAALSHEVLAPNSDLSNIEKEVLKRTCSELFELMLKLKTSNDLSEEQIAIKENISQEIRKEEFNIKSIIADNSENNLTINSLAEVSNEKVIVEQESELILTPEESPIFEAGESNEEVVIEESTELVNVMVEDTLIDYSIDLSEPIVTTEDNKPIEFLFDFPENNIIDAVKEAEPIEIKESVEVITEEYEVKAAPDPVEEIIVPVTYEEPQPEIKPAVEVKPIVIEEVKSKPAPFFSIGKTVMPQSETQSLNEKIAQKLDEFQFSEKIIEPKIDSLKTAISLNKKIAFVNELFKENVVEYAKSIDKINSAIDLDAALTIWNELKIVHNWSSDNLLVKDLEKLIYRRFS
jgi:hypothetical protein